MIHILCVDISAAGESRYQALYAQASPERKRRADGFLHREDQLRCVTAEALLRYALGGHCRVETGQWGKPYLPERPDFRFNLSHGGKWVVLAYGERDVGIDVEPERQDAKFSALARRYFTPEEQDYVFRSEDNQPRRFFEIWTKKESNLKYWGTGLGKSLSSFSVLKAEPGLHFHHRILPDGSHLSLCAEETRVEFSTVDIENL